MKLSGHTILITGGATGIGWGLTERFLSESNRVILCGRRQNLLDQAQEKHPSIVTFQCDLGDAVDRNRLYQWVKTEHPEVDVLVNNAGIQNWMEIGSESFYVRAKDEIAINAEAPLHLIDLFSQLPSMRTIINVSSGLAFVPLVNVPVYCATKAFLHSLTKSLREQLRGRNIEMIEVIPPALNTDLGGKGIHDAYPPVRAFIEAIFPQLEAGHEEVTFGFSEQMAASGQVFDPVFKRMNQLS